ncbi:hypothetical protein [Herbaspirillum autotrophicum]|uniref:hypothetical protein n=1 Tax=Herbaspirillum autotrophicum TaxID=180195 RepID=UPI00067B288C|nr:hypothetical protein [Herbaspirillum autotrophicum]
MKLTPANTLTDTGFADDVHHETRSLGVVVNAGQAASGHGVCYAGQFILVLDGEATALPWHLGSFLS